MTDKTLPNDPEEDTGIGNVLEMGEKFLSDAERLALGIDSLETPGKPPTPTPDNPLEDDDTA
jgi:hypothetical protein